LILASPVVGLAEHVKKSLIATGLIVVVVGVGAVLYVRSRDEAVPAGDAETRIVAYLKENVRPGQPVYVTELYNTVFTAPEEREVLERLHNMFFKIPAAAAQIYLESGRIPTLQELSNQFGLTVPGEMDILLKVMESDPRVPKFFERDPSSGEITKIDVDLIRATERFGDPLR
jgi:hypothetical protein